MLKIILDGAANLEMAGRMKSTARSILNIKEAFINDLSIPVAANLGPGAIGIVTYPVEED